MACQICSLDQESLALRQSFRARQTYRGKAEQNGLRVVRRTSPRLYLDGTGGRQGDSLPAGGLVVAEKRRSSKNELITRTGHIPASSIKD